MNRIGMEGCFAGQFCSPCYDYIVGKSVGSRRNPSQAYQNELVKANFRVLSRMRPEIRKYLVGSLYGKFGGA